jgi:hypothetical protein
VKNCPIWSHCLLTSILGGTTQIRWFISIVAMFKKARRKTLALRLV